MKCATTSLCAYLRQHPEIFVADPKDIYFFSNDQYYSKGWDWYLEKFKNTYRAKAIGEGTDNYSKQYEFPESPHRIKRHLPYVKLIYTVRNPVIQVESTCTHLAVRNGEKYSFNEAITSRKLYFDNCNYLKQIQAYYDIFEKEQIYVCFFEDMIRDIKGFLSNCFTFLGVDATFRIPDISARNTKEKRYGDRNITKILRPMPGAHWLVTRCPDAFKNKLRQFFQWRQTKKPMWSDGAKQEFLAHLTGPTRDFLKQHNKPQDYWDLEKAFNNKE